MTGHVFHADSVDPGYRPLCVVCGRGRHAPSLPVPRRPVEDAARGGRDEEHTKEMGT